MCKSGGGAVAVQGGGKDGDVALPSVKEIRDAIPAHCFKRSALWSSVFIARDSLLAAAVGAVAYNVLPFEWTPLAVLGWVVYAAVQGTVLTGLWVIGHECGHQAFSSSALINDSVGFVVHSSLLVPFFSWQRTHAVHHRRCNHLLDGESHVPDLKRKVFGMYSKVVHTIGEDAFVVLQIVLHLLFGWIMYLSMHATGSRRSPVTKQRYTRKPNHFSPLSSNELFPADLRFKIFLSSVGILGMLGVLAYAGTQYGFGVVALMYGGPYLVVNGWLVLYTWLQHTDPEVPHYGEDEWSWLKGAVSTIDRPYPWIVDELHHHIGTTHVCHHVFHELPHYNAVEATAALKKTLGSHYKYDPTPITRALWKTAATCHYVEGLEGVQYPVSVFDDLKAAKKLD